MDTRSGDGGRGDGVPRGFDGGNEGHLDGANSEPGGRNIGPGHLLFFVEVCFMMSGTKRRAGADVAHEWH